MQILMVKHKDVNHLLVCHHHHPQGILEVWVMSPRSLGDVTPKLKSVSTPSTPATDVTFELPLENVVLQGRVSSLSMSDHHTSHNTANPMPASITEYSPDGKVIIDKIYDDDDDDFEHDETSPFISKEKQRQLKKPETS